MVYSRLDSPSSVGSVVTPAGVLSRATTLNSAWTELAKSTGSPLVLSELAAWTVFYEHVRRDFLSRVFASGTLDELDQWEHRYRGAYANAGKGRENAPNPAYFTAEPMGAWVWAAGLLGVSVIAVVLAFRRSG
jgi:hypothetical protein